MSNTADSTNTAVLAVPKKPVGPGAATLWGSLFSVLVVALGVLFIREALLSFGVITGSSYVAPLLDAIDGLAATVGVAVIAVVVALLGLLLVIAALKPRPRKVVQLGSASGAYLRTRDVAALARGAAEEVDGVFSAKASASKRAVKLRVKATNKTSELESAVKQAVDKELQALRKAPSVKVKLHVEGTDS